MSIITAHWSVSPITFGDVQPLKEYHVEFASKEPINQTYNTSLLYQINNPDVKKVDWEKHLALFAIFKNFPLTEVTSYGTWHLNSDPRDGSSNIEIASLTMSGSDVQVTGPWGDNPHTLSHSLMHSYLIAVVCKLKNMNPLKSFSTSVEPSVLQNGPIYVVSTHGERALQTNDEGEDTVPSLNYFIFSGDNSCRWDLAALDPSEAHLLNNATSAVATCKKSASWIRNMASELLKNDLVKDLCGLDK